MKESFNKAKDKAIQLAQDLAPEASDIKRSADFAIDAAGKLGTALRGLGQDAWKSGMAKDAAAGAAIGAVIAVPVPIIGPIAGAVVGAGLGVYKNIVHGDTPQAPSETQRPDDSKIIEMEITAPATDRFEELNKLHELMVKGALTEEEFAVEKKKILDR